MEATTLEHAGHVNSPAFQESTGPFSFPEGSDGQREADSSLKEAILPGPKTNLIVNYIPSSMTGEELHALFSTIGPLKSSRIMMNRKSGGGLGYGFVDFEDAEHAQAAIDRLNGYKVQDKTLKVSIARPPSAEITDANLYVKGLPLTMTVVEFKELFEPFGEIVAVRVLAVDPAAPPLTATGQPKLGVGFVRFDKRKNAEAALAAMNGRIVADNTPLLVKFTNRDRNEGLPVPPVPLVPLLAEALVPVRNGYAMAGFAQMPHGSAFGHRNYPPHHGGFLQQQGYPPFHGHSPASYHTSPVQTVDPYSRFYSGSPVAQMSASPMHYAAVSSHSTFPSPPTYAYGVPGVAPWSHTQQALMPASTTGQLYNEENTLFVFNLPQVCDEAMLSHLFSGFGGVIKASIVRFTSATTNGFGFVTMASRHEAINAIANLNNSVIGRHVLQVSFKLPRHRRRSSTDSAPVGEVPHE